MGRVHAAATSGRRSPNAMAPRSGSPDLRPARQRRGPLAVLGVSFVAGSIPSSNIAARRRASVDLRTVGTGTVSGTGLYRVAGFGPLPVSGIDAIPQAA